MMRSLSVRTVIFLTMFCAIPAQAGIVVNIGDAADTDVLFWVETKSHHALIHGGHSNAIDARFMRPRETAEISVLALNPITFSFLYASAYHPAYIYDSRRVKELPSALNTVKIPTFEPKSWQEFMNSGEMVSHAGQGIHLGHVIGHFKLFIDPYLPAIDKAGEGDNVKKYFPLFEQLIQHTERTLPQSSYGMKSIDDRRKHDPAYAARLDQTEQRRLKELKELLAEIKGLLSMSAEMRVRLRSFQSKMVNTGSVYHELMTHEDRESIEEFLDFQFANSRGRPRPEKTWRWFGAGTNILYEITLGDRYVLNDRNGKRLYDNCYRTRLRVDLSPPDDTNLKNTKKQLNANFCHNDRGEWIIQLPGR